MRVKAPPPPALDRLPRVDRVARHPALASVRARLGAPLVTDLARRAIAEARDRVRAGRGGAELEAITARVRDLAEAGLASRTRRVINATGVLLHTHLGRAPLSAAAAAAVSEAALGYGSLEIDLATGGRGQRGAFVERGLASLAGAEAALVVNNNAAAVLLALTALAHGRGVVVSRGELVEIGGGFRIPEVLARSGARMIEVGTTNRTRVEDYAAAMDAARDVAVILRVHPGNFRQTGFVARPTVAALAAVARARGARLVEDQGGGLMVDLEDEGLSGEPVPRTSIEAGADLVCFSTDKVFGGPQGGALVGGAAVVGRVRRDPLARALRIGRLPLAALEATVAAYLEGDGASLPALAMLRAPLGDIRSRAAAWKEALDRRGVAVDLVDTTAAVGGGTFAGDGVPSVALSLRGDDPDGLAMRLRAGAPPVLGRVHDGRLLLDARTVLVGEDEALLAAIVAGVAAARTVAPERGG